MPESGRKLEQAIRERAYLIWEREGRPQGRSEDHWQHAITEHAGDASGQDDDPMEDEEKILAGRPDVNMPALLTKDVHGG